MKRIQKYLNMAYRKSRMPLQDEMPTSEVAFWIFLWGVCLTGIVLGLLWAYSSSNSNAYYDTYVFWSPVSENLSNSDLEGFDSDEVQEDDLTQRIDELITRICQSEHDGVRLFPDRNLVGINTLDVCREYLSPTEYQEYVDAVIEAGERVGYEFLSGEPFSVIYAGKTYTSTLKVFDSEEPVVEYQMIIGDFPGVTKIEFGCAQGLPGELVICQPLKEEE